ncbi:helix-turn-helix transcriptional regulator [Listeria monocytogenes]|nr:helix-turn-helix transcriptional regulator [Listeria monocytogenes]
MSKGDRIKELRRKKGMSQSDLAKHLNTTKQTISKYEKSIVTNIPSDKIEAMSILFNVSPEYILGWDIEIKKNPVATAERHFEILMDEDFVGMFDEFHSLDEKKRKIVIDLVHSLADAEV